ncbi:MAG: ATP-dependent protease subunit HslV [Clostridiales bacterium]|jgi:ATP-dependent HslUV protease subunit HslV|nr:ATP-dependent protease subunit HslV [Clostridiales bacterium]HHT08009.1 ATP-dependent protease subunit HslV [Clostridiales bacterium]
MELKGTTICAVKRFDRIAIAGDGQVTMGESTIFKSTAKKVRKIFNDQVTVGFAGSVADAFTLSERFEEKLTQTGGNLERAAVNLAREWRSDKTLRQLQAMLIAANKDQMLLISGTGEVIEADDGICAIGSGGNYALAAARALVQNTDLPAVDVARKALEIAASICVFTNDNILVEEVS